MTLKTEVFFDLDGVLADFDTAAERVLHTNNIYKWEFVHGTGEFWRRLSERSEFFPSIALMPDAHVLLDATKHLRTAVLTALPKTNAERVARQKREWVARMIGPDMPVITCFTYEKPGYCTPGAVLIDDRAINRDAWVAAGGHFIVHTSAAMTLLELERLGVLNAASA